MLDRAEWQIFRQIDPPFITRERYIRFLGNAELGDRISVALTQKEREGPVLRHRMTIARTSDGAVIAHAITTRTLEPQP